MPHIVCNLLSLLFFFFYWFIYYWLCQSNSFPFFKAVWRLKNHIQNAKEPPAFFISHRWAVSFLTLRVFSLSANCFLSIYITCFERAAEKQKERPIANHQPLTFGFRTSPLPAFLSAVPFRGRGSESYRIYRRV